MTSPSPSRSFVIENIRGIDPMRGVVATSISVRDGKIHAINSEVDNQNNTDSIPRIDGRGMTLTPGLIDLHIHGVHHFLFEQSADELVNCLAVLPRYGVTTVLPTCYRVMEPKTIGKLAELTEAMINAPTENHAYAPGFHLEGPFLKLPGAGAATLDGDVGFLDELIAAAQGRVSAMSISPDVKNIIPVIERLAEKNIAVFMTHTHASADETQAAIDAGARHATHFYDVFPVPDETDPGVRPVGAVEVILADDRVSVDFICDGVHVNPYAIRAALAAKRGGVEAEKFTDGKVGNAGGSVGGVGGSSGGGRPGVILITDANIGAGLPDGRYDTSWGFAVRIEAGNAARIDDPGTERDGGLAGSALTMDQGIANLTQWLPRQTEQAIWAMGSRGPADLVGLSDRGRLEVGAVADLVLWQTDDASPHRKPRAVMTWVNGTCVYQSDTA